MRCGLVACALEMPQRNRRRVSGVQCKTSKDPNKCMMKVDDDTANLEKDGVRYKNIHGDNDAVLPQVCNAVCCFSFSKVV